MKVFNYRTVSAWFAGLLLLSITNSVYAEANSQTDSMRDNPGWSSPPATAGTTQRHRSYGEKIGQKALRGAANIATSIVELPKNVILVTNDREVVLGGSIIWGLTVGSLYGAGNMAGRIASGLADLVTFPVPTKSIPQPDYPWENFNEFTTYGPIFELDDD